MENGIDKSDGSHRGKPANEVKFTEIEARIMCIICEEKTTADIADELNLHKRVVDRYRQKI